MSSVIQIGLGVTALWGSKMALSYYFGQWLIQQLVLPYKPWNGYEWMNERRCFLSMTSRRHRLCIATDYFDYLIYVFRQCTLNPPIICKNDPERGSAAGEIFWLRLIIRPARSVCVSLSAFFVDCCCQTKQDENGIIDSSELCSDALAATCKHDN